MFNSECSSGDFSLKSIGHLINVLNLIRKHAKYRIIFCNLIDLQYHQVYFINFDTFTMMKVWEKFITKTSSYQKSIQNINVFVFN